MFLNVGIFHLYVFMCIHMFLIFINVIMLYISFYVLVFSLYIMSLKFCMLPCIQLNVASNCCMILHGKASFPFLWSCVYLRQVITDDIGQEFEYKNNEDHWGLGLEQTNHFAHNLLDQVPQPSAVSMQLSHLVEKVKD